MNLRGLVCITATVVLLPALAYGQSSISGRVTDQARKALPGVIVTATGDAPGEIPRSVVTDPMGSYRLVNLQSGRYVLTFSLPGFDTVTRQGIQLANGRNATIDVALRVAALAQTRTFRRGPQLGPPLPPSPRQRDGRNCLHDVNETAAEAGRRQDALGAMRLIYYVAERSLPRSPHTPLPSWDTVAGSPVLFELRNTPGAVGELARRIQWGTSEPLPGWGIAYVTSLTDVRFALTDMRDQCGFTYSSADPDVIPRGGSARVVPLTE